MAVMDKDPIEIPYLKNIGLFVTYKCQVSCPHCVVEAGPHRKEEIRIRDAFDWIDQISQYRANYVRVLSLTGGEPFYSISKLKEISEFARDRGLVVACVTNGFWAVTKREATGVLKELRSISVISVSTDVYHLEQIPFQRVENAVSAARECGMPYSISVCTESESNPEYLTLIKNLKEITEEERINTITTFRAGRALKNLGAMKLEMSEHPPVSACLGACSPMIFPNGKVTACVGPVIDIEDFHPLQLGDLRDRSLAEILDDAERNPVLHTLRVWGPRKLVDMVREAGLGEHLPRMYVRESICHTCYDLMSDKRITDFLCRSAEEKEFREKVMYARAYYLNETDPQALKLAEVKHARSHRTVL
jgi:MoaA/NifB/PqqE/SkfB family radical SAM enzyme